MQVSRKTFVLIIVGVFVLAAVLGRNALLGRAEEAAPSHQTSAAKPATDEKPAEAVTNTGAAVDKSAAALMRKLYSSRAWLETARSFRIRTNYKGTSTAEGLRWEKNHSNSYGDNDSRTWHMQDEWAWDESHVLHRTQSHHEGESRFYRYTTLWNGSLAIVSSEGPDDKQYALDNKLEDIFTHTADMALLPWGPGDGYQIWWLTHDAAKFREKFFITPEDFELARQEDVEGKRCQVLESRAGHVRLYVGVADGRLYRRDILVARMKDAAELAIYQRIGGPSIKTFNDWTAWLKQLKPQDSYRAFRSWRQAEFAETCLRIRQTFYDYREVAPGCWLSFRQTMDTFETDSAAPFLSLRAEQTITDAAVNQPLPKDEFRVDLVDGVPVSTDWRYDPPISYIYRKDQTEAQRLALRDAERAKNPEWKSKAPIESRKGQTRPSPAPTSRKPSDSSGKTSAAKPETR
jgi:hypothetical protein